jgi:predicted TPR repeat methyltransferase
MAKSVVEKVKRLFSFSGEDVSKFLHQKRSALLEEFQDVREKLKDLGGTQFNLGKFHFSRGNVPDAILRFRLTQYLKPELPEAYYFLGRCYLLQEKINVARIQFIKALQLQSDYPEATYMLASLDEERQVSTIPLSIIEEYFDLAADDYNHAQLDELNYLGHQHIGNAVLKHITDKRAPQHVLDLGCGTGLCAAVVREHIAVASMTGVDISVRMLSQAKKLTYLEEKIFNALKKIDIKEFLTNNETEYQLMLAVFRYWYVSLHQPLDMDD